MAKPRGILLVRTDRIGELLLTTPAFGAVRESFPGAKITLIVKPSSSVVVEGNPCIDSIVKLDPGSDLDSLSKRLRFIRFLGGSGFDMAIIFNPSKFFNIAAFLAGIPVRVGYDRKLGFLLTNAIEDRKYLCEKHEVEYNLELVSLVGAKTDNKSLSLTIDNNVSKELNIENSDNLVALHPWTSDPIKQWPEKNFYELGKRLIKELNMKVVVIGGKEESGKSAELFNNFDINLNNIAGKTTLKQLAAILKKCKLLVSCDSGPMHLACAVGTPVIAIFRNDIIGKSPKRWGPWGKEHSVTEKNNLFEISVDEVFNKIKEKLLRK